MFRKKLSKTSILKRHSTYLSPPTFNKHTNECRHKVRITINTQHYSVETAFIIIRE